MGRYSLVFDKAFVKQLKKLEKDKALKELVNKMLEKIEEMGLWLENCCIHALVFLK